MKRLLIALTVLFAVTGLALAQAPFTVKDLIAMKRVADPRVSPDGRTVLYTVGVVDLASNKTLTQIYSRPVSGGAERQLTNDSSSSSQPRWSPDGKRIAFVHGGQIWTMDPNGSDRRQVTSLSTGAGGPVWSRDGKQIAFGSDVYPECTSDACNKAEAEKAENSKVKAHVTERLLFRHWVEWRDRLRTHVFVVSSSGGIARDVTPGDFDAPPYGAATGVDYTFTPDGSGIVFLRNPDKVEALSTNSDIYIASLSKGEAKNITAANHGYDASPMYTPDGRYLLYRSQATATFEADRWRIMRYDPKTGESVELTRGFDQQVDEFTISPDSKTVYFTAGQRGKAPIFSVPVEPDFRLRIATHVSPVVNKIFASSLNVSGDGSTIVFIASSNAAPADVMKVAATGSGLEALTAANRDALQKFGLKAAEDVEWTGAVNRKIHGFILKPANFDVSKKYPLLVLIHGGPQGAWNDNWGYRWNPQIFANAGYVVFMPNPRGSTGYGQQFVNEITGDWGGKAFVDISNGVAMAVKLPFIDKGRIGAAGASYGGYMVDWLLGHNNDPRFKYKAFVSHAGVYNLESMSTATEELWFVNWEFKGFPWENRVNYERWSPSRFAKNFDTPTLVTAGEIDYRVPVDQSYQLFTTLQLRNVPSKLLVFPDEGHWIQKPQNSELWYNNVLNWFNKYLK
ncbi:MAG: S9 family peptidase [Pyrinomonadaceae bacterium]|nr:S9 family peptidase [Pyrinomonadaceae bacterium]